MIDDIRSLKMDKGVLVFIIQENKLNQNNRVCETGARESERIKSVSSKSKEGLAVIERESGLIR